MGDFLTACETNSIPQIPLFFEVSEPYFGVREDFLHQKRVTTLEISASMCQQDPGGATCTFAVKLILGTLRLFKPLWLIISLTEVIKC